MTARTKTACFANMARGAGDLTRELIARNKPRGGRVKPPLLPVKLRPVFGSGGFSGSSIRAGWRVSVARAVHGFAIAAICDGPTAMIGCASCSRHIAPHAGGGLSPVPGTSFAHGGQIVSAASAGVFVTPGRTREVRATARHLSGGNQ